jgi:hypothetical protein
MYFKTVLFIAVIVLTAFAAPSNIAQLRSEYLKAESNSGSVDKLMSLTNGQTDALSKAYRGAAWAFKAKHHINPAKKLDYVKTGLLTLNQAVTIDSKDIEVRFIRFSIEENIPSIVSFTSHLKEDKQYILDNIDKNHGFYSTIKGYMKQSKNLSSAEKSKLN